MMTSYTYDRYTDGQTISDEPMVLKRCGVCHDPKPLEAFSRDKSKHDGLRNTCKACDNINRKERYQNAR